MPATLRPSPAGAPRCRRRTRWNFGPLAKTDGASAACRRRTPSSSGSPARRASRAGGRSSPPIGVERDNADTKLDGHPLASPKPMDSRRRSPPSSGDPQGAHSRWALGAPERHGARRGRHETGWNLGPLAKTDGLLAACRRRSPSSSAADARDEARRRSRRLPRQRLRLLVQRPQPRWQPRRQLPQLRWLPRQHQRQRLPRRRPQLPRLPRAARYRGPRRWRLTAAATRAPAPAATMSCWGPGGVMSPAAKRPSIEVAPRESTMT